MKTQTSRTRESGFTLVEIILVVSLIVLIGAIGIPNFLRARFPAQKNACIANLRLIDSAVQQWALENKQPASATVVAANVTPYLRNNAMPEEPAGGAYSVTTTDESPTCSLAVAGHTL
jgi:type II secretory pathway pseudopilin PulG